jgi:hypothetical protein
MGEWIRAEHVYDIGFGDVVHDTKNCRWVCVGSGHNSLGTFPIFVKDHTGVAGNIVYRYDCAGAETLLKHFPDIIRYRRADV